MNLKRIHKITGIALALPLLGWALTGIIFLTKPGYEGAYEILLVKTYPLEKNINFTPKGEWHSAQTQRTILGDHLLLSNDLEQLHLDPATLLEYPLPSSSKIQLLIEDAITVNPARYGSIIEVTSDTVITDTGVEIVLDWPTLSLQQRGVDTQVISILYKIHYLQWLGTPLLDRILGALGIVLLLLLVSLGLANSRKKSNSI